MAILSPDAAVASLLALLVVVALLPTVAEGAAAPLSADEIKRRIETHRTADVTLTVTDAAGKPLAGAQVTVRQERHKFLFGCNAFAINTADTSPDQLAYRKRYAELLNYATLPFYWGGFEPAEGKPGTARVRAMAEWCAANHIRAKGHPLCWHEVPAKWLDGKPLEEVQALQLGRIKREVSEFAGLIDTWDVVNEAVVMPNHQPDKNRVAQLCKKLGTVELIKQTFNTARETNAKATLLLNDYDTSAKYEALIKDCLAAGVPIDVIGIQSHMHGGYWGAGRAWAVCEQFARFGKPLHFTETTIQSGEIRKSINYQGHYTDWPSTPEGEKRQGEQVAEFYRILFSHPAVAGITWWDFSDKGAWLGAPSGLIRTDMSPKPAYEALLKMVKQEWWTGPLALTADNEGRVVFRGFLGDYAVESAAGTAKMQLNAPGKSALAVTLAAAPTKP
ncbi:MAG: endo-1,4-beta-xylanase [Planctomycetota bacterium]|nr:endo-1,4-beta-xylanase [Planctomycetota bacterium]